MIPKIALTIVNQRADVLSGNLATEQHGDERVAFIDLKFRLLLQKPEINELFRINEQDPTDSHKQLFNKNGEFRVPGIQYEAPIRKTIKGRLDIKNAAGNDISFEDAHVVGTVSRVTLKMGGTGQLVLQLRVAPDDHTDQLLNIIEEGECMMEFAEYADNVSAPGNDNQEELAV